MYIIFVFVLFVAQIVARNESVIVYVTTQLQLIDGDRDLIYSSLYAHAQAEQQNLLSLLSNSTNKFSSFTPLWIQNVIVIYDASYDLILQLSHHPDVTAVESDQVVSLIPYSESDEISRTQSNIEQLHAPEAWKLGIEGKNVLVASIDSGVRYSHQTLMNNYRGFVKSNSSFDHDYSFWIPDGQQYNKLTPDTADLVGHGTHTMGTAVGQLGIGMAPGAQWIAAQAFNWDGSSTQSHILRAAEWVMCPTKMDGTKPRCDLGAHIVSNSFGGNHSTHWMDPIVHTWRKAGIIPVFASGNTNGFQCGSVLCPGCIEEAIAVGALVENWTLWGASGKGPGRLGNVKPDFVAPGVAIRSALSTGDRKYTRLTGTSMATPHITGALALLLGADGSQSHNIVEALRKHTSHALSKPVLVASECGKIPYNVYPNNIYGWGLPNVCESLTEFGFDCTIITTER